MKKLLAAIILMTSVMSWADALQDGVREHENKDYKAAFIKFKAAAEQGLPTAQYMLGFMYRDGTGTAQDYKEGFRWIKAAAEQGLSNAQLSLAEMYENGKGVVQDYKEAVRWTRTAAEQGNEMAQYTLALRYAKGQGVLQDYILAYMWFNIAAVGGDKDALRGREIAATLMTPKQISEAQKLSRECQERNLKKCN